jgi:nickel-dependent lactate racemase
MLGDEVVAKYQVLNHDCQDQSRLVETGSWGENFPIFLNRDFVESDIKITTGFVEPHFFAGFSGGPKLVAPGLAGIETIMQLHSAELIADPGSVWGNIETNRLHQSIREIVSRVGVDFSFDVTLNRDRQITGVYAGRMETAHAEACRAVKKSAMQKLNQAFDIVITTNSGFPLDLNLYQSVKGMSAASRVVKTGGDIICAAECSDGIPEHGLYGRILNSVKSPNEIIDLVFSPGFHQQDQWQVQIQAMIQQKANVHVKSRCLSHSEIRRALFEPVDNIEDLISKLSTGKKITPSICVLPEGPQTIPYLSEEDGID